ncbi:hypothetical protein BD779DRAFT_1801919 [Infundibulicybe gibba]|nr:hypothetical protein BD779DRAFT_1801919 [Infundibulicybe gibba]
MIASIVPRDPFATATHNNRGSGYQVEQNDVLFILSLSLAGAHGAPPVITFTFFVAVQNTTKPSRVFLNASDRAIRGAPPPLFLDLLIFRQINQRCMGIAHRILRSRQRLILSYHVPDMMVSTFIRLLDDTSSSVTGSTAWLLTDLLATWKPRNLNVLAPGAPAARRLCEFLVSQAYAKQSVTLWKETEAYLHSGHTFSLGGCVVMVFQVSRSGIQVVSGVNRCSSSSSLMSSTSISTLYPSLTLNRKAIFFDDPPPCRVLITHCQRDINLDWEEDFGDNVGKARVE